MTHVRTTRSPPRRRGTFTQARRAARIGKDDLLFSEGVSPGWEPRTHVRIGRETHAVRTLARQRELHRHRIDVLTVQDEIDAHALVGENCLNSTARPHAAVRRRRTGKHVIEVRRVAGTGLDRGLRLRDARHRVRDEDRRIVLSHQGDHVQDALDFRRHAEDDPVRLCRFDQRSHLLAVRMCIDERQPPLERQVRALEVNPENRRPARRPLRPRSHQTHVRLAGTGSHCRKKPRHAILRKQPAQPGKRLGTVVHEELVHPVDVQVDKSRCKVVPGCINGLVEFAADVPVGCDRGNSAPLDDDGVSRQNAVGQDDGSALDQQPWHS